jgi:uncharacterized protein YecT (DUF1311 family)
LKMRLWRIIGLTAAIVLAACTATSGSSSVTPSSNDKANLDAGAAQPTSSSAATDPVSKKPKEEASDEGATAMAEQTQNSNLRDSYYECAASNDGSTWDMQSCIEKEFEYQDARLNALYRELRFKLQDAQKVRLRDEERKWLLDKDEACKWNAETEGQAQRIEANICALKKTAERAGQLEKMLRELGSS